MRKRRFLQGLLQGFLAYDIGLARFRTALHVLICMATGLCVGGGLAALLGMPTALGLTVGGVSAFQLAFGISDKTWQAELRRSFFTLLPMCGGFALSVVLHAFRPLALLAIIVVLVFQLYASRLGLRATDVATGLYGTFLIGLLIPLEMPAIPVMLLIIVLSGLAAMAVRSLVLRPNAQRSLLLARKGYWLRLRAVIFRSVERMGLSHQPSKIKRIDQKLAEALRNMQAAALQMDGLISFEGSKIQGSLAYDLNQIIFDTEQGVSTIARYAAVLSNLTEIEIRDNLIAVLQELEIYDERIGQGFNQQLANRLGRLRQQVQTSQNLSQPDKNLLLYFIHNLEWLAGLHDKWVSLWGVKPEGVTVPFESVIKLAGVGKLPGSFSVVSQTKAHEKLSIQARTALQAVIALIIMEPIALFLSSYRFYWGDIGVMVVLAGAFTQRERLRKTWARIWGTALGAAIGLLLAHFIGQNGFLEVSVIVLGLAFGSFHIATRYGLWVTGLVVALCQMYQVTGVLTPWLMPLRLLENGLGAIIACAVSALVLPISSKENLHEGLKKIFASVERFAISLPLNDKAELRAFTNEMNLGLHQLRSGSLYPVGLLPVSNPRDVQIRAQLESLFHSMGQLTVLLESSDTIAYGSLKALSYEIRQSVQRLQALCSGQKTPDSCQWTELDNLPQTREIELLTRIRETLSELEKTFVEAEGS